MDAKFDSFVSWKEGRPSTIYSSNNDSAAVDLAKRGQHNGGQRRIRHNSEGNYDDVNLVQEALFTSQKNDTLPTPAAAEENIYENLMPLYNTEVNNNNNGNAIGGAQNLTVGDKKFAPSSSAAKSAGKSSSGQSSKKSSAARHLNMNGVITPPLSSDTSSLDSHNDSGYSTRMGVSDGPSPLMCDTEPMLDPKAVFMIPKDVVANSPFVKAASKGGNYGANNAVASAYNNGSAGVPFTGAESSRFGNDDVMINKKSSFV